MNIELFYQLRERLCAAAAAGCATISEDFRLQRAVEEFEPLAKANKVFGRLHAMCTELLANGKPALLADCIALCNALAVTQGTFKDNSEVTENTGVTDCEPSELSYSSIKHSHVFARQKDPRIINEYLRKISSSISDDTKQFFIDYGKGIVPALKQRINTIDTKEKGIIVKMVGELSGAEENDWYLSLIDDEENTQSVRVHAAENLRYDKSNAGKLLELWQTEKAAVRDAAALSLIQLDVPESGIVIEKIISKKFAKKNADFIGASRSKKAVDFAVDYAEKFIEEEEKSPKAKNPVYDYDLALQMLANKTGIEDILNKIAEHNGMVSSSNAQLAEMLLANLAKYKDEEYRVLIENLYRRNPDYFAMPYMFMIMAEDRGVDITDLPELADKYRWNLLSSLYEIKYDRLQKRYILPVKFSWYRLYNDKAVKGIPMEDGRIDKILELISDVSYMKEPVEKLRLIERQYFDYRLYKVKGDDYTDRCIYNALRVFEFLYNYSAPEDKEKIYSAGTDFCKTAMKYFPSDDLLAYICKHDVQYIRDNPDLLEDTVMFRLEKLHIYVRSSHWDEIPRDVLDAAIPKLYKKLKAFKSAKVSKDTVSWQIHEVERFIEKNGYDKEKILKGNE